jgi:hypothetical protein
VTPSINLPTEDGGIEAFALSPARSFARPTRPFSRIAYAAAHVVANPLANTDPWLRAAIDWDATIAYRRYLWSLGFGVAEAMDTAQRGSGLDWPDSLELIRRSIDAARDFPGAIVACGAGTDDLPDRQPATIEKVIRSYEMQCEAIEKHGGRIILMASRALAAAAGGPDDYRRVYQRILSQVRGKVIIHWLGEMFDPALYGYWGTSNHHKAMDVCLEILELNAAKIDGIKISLLDREKEIAIRRRLPPGLRMYTGDDFNYAELIAGDSHGHSDALLGIFDVIAPAAAAALAELERGDEAGFHALLVDTVALSRHIFQAPTRFYKTGVVFAAYLNGHQTHFAMVGGQQSARSIRHLAELFRLADRCGLLLDPEMAARRMQSVLAVYGL